MHNVEVEVGDAPVGELLLRNRNDVFLVVEGLRWERQSSTVGMGPEGTTNVPKLGHDEEVLSLDDTLLDGPSDALAGFDLVAVVCGLC